MQSSSSTTFEELVQCSVCLERYTNPKMLPCQHTYCYSCLLRLCKGRSNVTCPQCRVEHDIPKDGVAHFKDSLLAKELVSTLMAKEECCDCQEKVAVSLCEHCDTQLCVQCLVQHAKLSSEISSSLGDLNDDLLSEESKRRVDEKKLELEEFVNDLNKEIVRVKRIFDEAIQKLVTRRNLFASFMEVIVRIYGDMLNLSGDSYIADLSARLLDRKTTNSLKELKNNLVDLRTVTRLIQKRSDQFMFAGDANTIQKLESFGHVEFGQAVIDIKGTYTFHQGAVHENVDNLGQERNIPSSVVKTTKDVQTWTDIQPEDGAVVSGVNTSRTATSDVSTSTEIWPETESSRNDSTGAEHANKEQEPANVACLAGAASLPVLRRDPTPPTGYKQNQLPTNVNYMEKGTGGEIIIGHGRFARDHQRLSNPYGCCYHVTNDEVYVADHGNDRVMVYDSKGRNGRVFYSDIGKPTDVAISDNGELVFLLQETALNIVSVSGKLVRIINSFPLGNLEKCYAVCIHNQHVLVLDSGHKCVIVFNSRGDYVRHFGFRYLSIPSSMTVAGNGDVYVTDGESSCVHVFKWNGKFSKIFGQLDDNDDIDGISVDGDGYVCVSRYLGGHIDVYDPQWRLVTSFGEHGERPGCLNRPLGLCLMPDGRLIVAEYANNRLQIF